MELTGSEYIVIDSNSGSEVDFSTNLGESEKELLNKEINAIKYLCLLKEPFKIISSAKACDALELILNNCTEISAFDLLECHLKECYVDIIVNFIKKQYENIKDIVRKFEFSFKPQRLGCLELLLCYLKNFLKIICFTTKKSTSFCIKFQENKGLTILFAYLTNEVFVTKLAEYSHKDINNGYENLKQMMECLLGALHNLSLAAAGFKLEWNKNNSVEKFLNLAESIGSISDFRLTIYVSIANVFDDQLSEMLSDCQIKLVVKDIIELTAKCAMSIAENTCQRKVFKIDESDTEPQELAYIISNDNEWNILEFLNSLYHLALSDRIKYDMYETHLMKEYLRIIIYSGNEKEVEFSLRVLWQFCFDKRIANHVHDDEKLNGFIESLSTNEKIKSKRLEKYASGILWLICKKKKTENKREKFVNWIKKKEDNMNGINRQVMISYNRESRDICLRLKSEIEKIKVNVWIDVEHIHGSSLESMANAIENSDCILICMSEKYKQSPFCRAEAEYAFQLKKPIIPLIMEQGYKPDGWLGIILGSKIFVDFTKYDFDESKRRVLKELCEIYNQVYLSESSLSVENSKLNLVDESSESKNVINSNKVVYWSLADVEKWFEEKNINSKIKQSILPCDGKVLDEIYQILLKAPEAFFKILNKKSDLNMRDLAHFSSELKEIFKT